MTAGTIVVIVLGGGWLATLVMLLLVLGHSKKADQRARREEKILFPHSDVSITRAPDGTQMVGRYPPLNVNDTKSPHGWPLDPREVKYTKRER